MLVREFLLLPRTDFPCCLAILSHWLGAAFGNLRNKAIDFRVQSAGAPGQLHSLESHIWEAHSHGYPVPSFESHTPIFPHGFGRQFLHYSHGLVLPEKTLREGKEVCGWPLSLIAAVFRAAADTHLVLSLWAITNVAVMQPLLFYVCTHMLREPICKPNTDFPLLFQLVIQDPSQDHRCMLGEGETEKLNSCCNFFFL